MIRIVEADVATFQADALVRSVGTDLEACTPMCARVGREAGEELLERVRRGGEVPVGGAILTPGGRLPSSYLLHLVLRSEEEPVSEQSVARALRNGLRQAAEWQVERLAVPPLGTGAGNLDAEISARVMCRVLSEHRQRSEFPKEVVIVVTNAYEAEAFAREVARASRAGEGVRAVGQAGLERGPGPRGGT